MTNDVVRTRAPRAAKAAAKKAAPRRPAAIEGTIVGKARTEALTAAAPTAPVAPRRPTVTWKGRSMPVVMPTGDQLAVVLDTYEELSSLSEAAAQAAEAGDEASAEGQRVMRLLRRAFKGTLIVLSEEDDREWVKDRVLEGKYALNDVAELFPLALNVLGAKQAKPPAKARRRT